jgi:hypothetical protein
MKDYFTQKVSNFIIKYEDINKINNIKDIEEFWKLFSSSGYFSFQSIEYIKPWIAMIFMNNTWQTYEPSNQDILEYILHLKNTTIL